jgi:putative membrane protein
VTEPPPPAPGTFQRRIGDAGSRARTHFANERTFLAWLRTEMSLVAVGLAAASFIPIDLIPGFPLVRTFAILLVLSGTGMVAYGGVRFQQTYRAIEDESYGPSTLPILAVAAIIGVLGLMAIPVVVLLR